MGWGVSEFNFWGQETHVRVILVLRECIWNMLAVLLVPLAFDDTGFLGSPPCFVVYHPGTNLGDCLKFP